MATVYPGAIDSLVNPTATDPLAAPSHADQHADANDALVAIETALGVDPQGAHADVSSRLDAIEPVTVDATGPLAHIRDSWLVVEDFVVGSVADSSTYPLSISGAGAAGTNATLLGDLSPGVAGLNTGTEATGEARLTAAGNLRFSAGVTTVFEARVRLSVLADAGVDEYDAYIGFGVLPSPAFIRFRYERSTSDNWLAEHDTSVTDEQTVTSVGVAAGAWITFTIEVTGLTSVVYKINDATVATQSVSITSGDTGSVAVGITKSLGTTPVTLYVDYLAVGQRGLSR